jgi:uncharacterized protein YoxC
MARKVKLNETQLRRMISETVKKVVNEVSNRTVSDALEYSSNYNHVLDEINEKFEELQDSLADIADCGWNNVKPVNNEAKGIYDDLSNVFERFKRFYARKQNQRDSFHDEYINRGRPDIEQ